MLLQKIKNLIIEFLMLLILTIRPLLGPEGCCKYPITCTEFAQIQFKENNFFKAFWEIFKRVLSCNPISTIFQKK